MPEQISALKKKGAYVTSGDTVPGGNNIPCKHCEVVSRKAPHRRNSCYFELRKNKDRKYWSRRIMGEKGINFNDECHLGTAKKVEHKTPNNKNLMYEDSLSCSPTPQTYIPKISEKNKIVSHNNTQELWIQE